MQQASRYDRSILREGVRFASSLLLACSSLSCNPSANAHGETVLGSASTNPLATTSPSPLSTGSVPSSAASAAPEQSARPIDSATTSNPGDEPLLPFDTPLPEAGELEKLPAMRFARLTASECRKELGARHVPHRLEQRSTKQGGEPATPLRLTGPLHEVSFRAPAPPVPFGKLDCRLAVALEAMARLLARYQVVAVQVDNMYRPGAIVAGKNEPSQHAEGLAIDIMAFELFGRRELLVERDWHGKLKKPYCGPDAVIVQKNEAATTLRNLTCHLIRSGIFHHAVTPSDNLAHRDHLHFDLDPEAKRVRVEP